jgi:hypothetical protein
MILGRFLFDSGNPLHFINSKRMLPFRTAAFLSLLCSVIFPFTVAAGQSTGLALPPSGAPGLTRMDAAQAGVPFANLCPVARSLTNQIYLNGSGVAAGDIDGDGWCDVTFPAALLGADFVPAIF